MRYYRIEITNAQTGLPIKDAKGQPLGPWSSISPNGLNNPGALDIQLDIPVVPFDQPMGLAFLKIWGLGLPVLGQASQFNPGPDGSSCNIAIFGGMSKGLPLANPSQAGLLVSGGIQQAFSNWQGTEQTLDFVIVGNGGQGVGYGHPYAPKHIVLNWTPGQNLGDAVANALKVAFPKAKITGSADLSPNLALYFEQQTGVYNSVAELADYVANVSASIVNGGDPAKTYPGVSICPTENGFNLFDGTTQTAPVDIALTDLIGQPSWLNVATMTVKVVMRAKIALGAYIRMPQQAIFVNTVSSQSAYRNSSTFKGVFQVISVRHIGRFRQAKADAWVTVLDAITVPDNGQ